MEKIPPVFASILNSLKKNSHEKIPAAFTLILWDGSSYRFGEGDANFSIVVKNNVALAALMSFDELRIAEAYMNELLDFEGDMQSLIGLRMALTDLHPFIKIWRFITPLFTKTIAQNRKDIFIHYDYECEFYLSFLDSTRCYSQAVFSSDEESLEIAQKRKFDYAIESCKIQPGNNVLDVGGGWGAFTEYAGMKGIHVTSLTISNESEHYISKLITEKKLPCRVLNIDFLIYSSDRLFDAIVILGVMEHLPNYRLVVKQLQRLLKPGGKVYIDASATDKKFDSPLFITKYIFPGRHSFFCLQDFLSVIAKENFEVISVINDRLNYLQTCKRWAQNLEQGRSKIINQWGERLFRMFHLYLWGSVYGFKTKGLSAYRVVIEKYHD